MKKIYIEVDGDVEQPEVNPSFSETVRARVSYIVHGFYDNKACLLYYIYSEGLWMIKNAGSAKSKVTWLKPVESSGSVESSLELCSRLGLPPIQHL